MKDKKTKKYDEKVMSEPENFEVASAHKLNRRGDHQKECNSYAHSSPTSCQLKH